MRSSSELSSPAPVVFSSAFRLHGRQSQRLAPNMLLLHAIDGVFDSTEQESTPEWMIRLGGEWLPFALVFTCGWIPVPDKPRGDRKVQKNN